MGKGKPSNLAVVVVGSVVVLAAIGAAFGAYSLYTARKAANQAGVLKTIGTGIAAAGQVILAVL